MDDTPHKRDRPPGWAEALDESLAELAVGVPTIPYADVRRELLGSIGRMEAAQGQAPECKATSRR